MSTRHNEKKGDPIFRPGDKVKIVDCPRYCEFSWIGSMNKYCGMEVVVTKAIWSIGHGCYAYRIDVDNSRHAWCANCFEEDSIIEESDSDISLLIPWLDM